MLKLIALAPVLAITGAHGPIYSGMPPERFQGEGVAVVAFVNDVSAYCGPAPEGYTILACAKRTREGTPVLFMPNPCYFPEQPYAALACHEKAHSLPNGWGRDHEF